MKWRGRITGTINDEFSEIEADTEEEARKAALLDWRYVEFEDLEVSSIEPEEEHEMVDGPLGHPEAS